MRLPLRARVKVVSHRLHARAALSGVFGYRAKARHSRAAIVQAASVPRAGSSTGNCEGTVRCGSGLKPGGACTGPGLSARAKPRSHRSVAEKTKVSGWQTARPSSSSSPGSFVLGTGNR